MQLLSTNASYDKKYLVLEDFCWFARFLIIPTLDRIYTYLFTIFILFEDVYIYDFKLEIKKMFCFSNIKITFVKFCKDEINVILHSHI